MRIDILTLFPDMFQGPFQHSIVKRACDGGLLSIHLHDIRDWAKDKHQVVDDYPYGGGPGMVLKPEPVFAAVEAVQAMADPPGDVVLLTPIGRKLDHALVMELQAPPRLLLLCGHYEGVDARVHRHLASMEISIGDYVLSGGELAAMVLVDAVARQLTGVLGDPQSAVQESFAAGLLEHPHYTRPADFRGFTVPEVLLSGDHAKIARWRRRESIFLTARRRPELLPGSDLTAEEHGWLADTAEDS